MLIVLISVESCSSDSLPLIWLDWPSSGLSQPRYSLAAASRAQLHWELLHVSDSKVSHIHIFNITQGIDSATLEAGAGSLGSHLQRVCRRSAVATRFLWFRAVG